MPFFVSLSIGEYVTLKVKETLYLVKNIYMLILIHKEECQFCGKVRQFMSDYHISYISIVSPDGAPSREILIKLGGKQEVPFLVDTDNAKMMYESKEIIKYLDENYVK